jgi:hypothetical protein
MKTYKTQEEVERDVKDGVLYVNESVAFECSINLDASIIVAGDINAKDINAKDINAWNIIAEDINTKDITAEDINVWDINAMYITAKDIKARNIIADDIKARHIRYWAFCCVLGSISCLSIEAKRAKYADPICLDGRLKVRDVLK